MSRLLIHELKKNQKNFHSVVPFDPSTEKIICLDLSKNNIELIEDTYSDPKKFSEYITAKIKTHNAKFAIGGYNENRNLYKTSKLFEIKNLKVYPKGGDLEGASSRTLHLGIDIWGDAGTPVSAPLGGITHSFAFNNTPGDYGATIILQHQLGTLNFYTLYGHLSLEDIGELRVGQFITRGQVFGHFGEPNENGNWPSHLHFQLIVDIGNYHGDYPGVCNYTERKYYLENSPDPDIILCFSTEN